MSSQADTTSALLQPDSLTLQLDLFQIVDFLSCDNEMVYVSRQTKVKLEVTSSKRVGFTLWGLSEPIHCELQIVPDMVSGQIQNLNLPRLDLPVCRDIFPERIAAFDFDTHAVVMVPITPHAQPWKHVQFLQRGDVSDAEAHEERQSISQNFHMVFIDLTPRRHPPPNSNRPVQKEANTLFRAA